mmetsp:Transcript_104882/g.234100  ORF Transcript_104882/g.234100 Transcript_104882/m.234100 type:complete len:205 (+) Transcript_104882:199-813(+)
MTPNMSASVSVSPMKKLNRSLHSAFRAMSRATPPDSDLCPASAELNSRAATTSVKPPAAASKRGVSPRSSAALGSAPPSSKCLTSSRSPTRQAKARGNWLRFTTSSTRADTGTCTSSSSGPREVASTCRISCSTTPFSSGPKESMTKSRCSALSASPEKKSRRAFTAPDEAASLAMPEGVLLAGSAPRKSKAAVKSALPRLAAS